MRYLMVLALLSPAVGWGQVRVLPVDPQWTGPAMLERQQQIQRDWEQRAFEAEQWARWQDEDQRRGHC